MKNRLIITLTLLVGLLLVAGLAAQDEARPFLGITFDPVEGGAVVTSIVPDSAADAAGLENGDVITAVNGEAVTDLAAAIGALSAGDQVTLDVLRGEEQLTLDALLQARPEPFAQGRFRFRPFEQMERAYLGVSLESREDGVVITAVTAGSPAAEAGLQVDDVISAIDGEAIEDAAGAAALIGTMEPGDTVTLDIRRADEALSIEVTLGSWMRGSFQMTMPGDVVVFDGSNWRIIALAEDSPLAEAGLQAGDIITAINGESVDPGALADVEGDVTLTVQRGDETLEITLAADDLAVFGMFGMRGMFRGGDMPFRFDLMPGNARLGVQFQTIDEAVAEANNLSVTEGALITDVLADSAAAEAGLQVGDVVTAVEGDVVDAPRTLRERLLAYDPGDTVTLDVLRGEEALTLDVTLAGAGMNFDGMPFDFGRGDFPRFFFGPDGFRFGPDNSPIEPARPAPNV